jgi:DNA polymerase III alpha subunit
MEINKITIKFLCGIAYQSLEDKCKCNGFDKELYTDRLNAELVAIDKKGCADKFIIAADIANYAKANKIMMFGVWGCCSSLLLYLLGVTPIDPIKYGLHFERFIDDLRFCFYVDYERCEELALYVQNKYGEQFAFSERQDYPLRRRNYSFSQLGIRLDCMHYLTVVAKMQDIIKARNADFDISKIPFDDIKTFEMIQKGDTEYAYDLAWIDDNLDWQPQTITDLFAAQANGKIAVDGILPKSVIDKLLSETHGYILYHEQVMDILRQLPDLNDQRICDLLNSPKLTNKNYAVSEGYLSYITAYLKSHYPKEYCEVVEPLCEELADEDLS